MDSIESFRDVSLLKENDRREHLNVVFLAQVWELIDHHPVALPRGVPRAFFEGREEFLGERAPWRVKQDENTILCFKDVFEFLLGVDEDTRVCGLHEAHLPFPYSGQWLLSQNGLLRDFPQRQSVTRLRIS